MVQKKIRQFCCISLRWQKWSLALLFFFFIVGGFVSVQARKRASHKQKPTSNAQLDEGQMRLYDYFFQAALRQMEIVDSITAATDYEYYNRYLKAPEMMYCLEHARAINPASREVPMEIGLWPLEHMNVNIDDVLYTYCPLKDSLVAQVGEDSIGVRKVLEDLIKNLYTAPVSPYYLERMAEVSSNKTSNMGYAIVALKKLSEVQPERKAELTRRIVAYEECGYDGDRGPLYDKLEAVEGETEEILWLRYRDADEKAKIKLLKHFLRKNPHNMNVTLTLASHYLNKGENKRAAKILKAARTIDPENAELGLLMVDYLDSVGRKEESRIMEDSLLLYADMEDDVRINRTRKRMEEILHTPDSLNGALTYYHKIAQRYPCTDMVRMCYYFTCKHNASQDTIAYYAQILFNEFNESNSDMTTIGDGTVMDVGVLDFLFEYYLQRKQFAQAEEICRMGMDINSDFYRLQLKEKFAYRWATVLNQQQRYMEAIDAIEKIVNEIKNEELPYFVARPRFYHDSEVQCRERISQGYSILGDMYYQQKDYSKAFAAYDSALIYVPDNAACLNNYAYYLTLRNEQPDKAEEMAHRSVELDSLNKTYLDTYAWVLYANGRAVLAKFYIDRVVSPQDSDEILLNDESLSAEILQHAAAIYAACQEQKIAQRYKELAEEKHRSQVKKALEQKNNKNDTP